ncbi:MAG: class I SAM-dependent methyltransferase [Desulfuromonadales bacterium]
MSEPAKSEAEGILQLRHQAEEAFHDRKYAENENEPAHYRLGPTLRVFLRLKERLGDIRDRNVLEYGCGSGWVTADLAALGAKVDAFDISREAVANTKVYLAERGLNACCNIRKMSAEQCDYPDNRFDVVVGFAILHHLDLEKALAELHRMLKPGGVALFAEPLGSNPLLNLYRQLTPQYRTPDERPLVLREFAGQARMFGDFRHEEFYLTAMAPLLLGMRKGFDLCSRLDRAILRRFPEAGRWAWYSLLELRK